jgi:hypothetical protein
MKKRILTGWSFTRVLYLILGGMIIAQSIVNIEWLGIVIGAYFSSMGLFAFGCASGNCFGGNCEVQPREQSNATK